MNILGILPESIGGRLTISSIFDGFVQNNCRVVIFDKLFDKPEKFSEIVKQENFDYIAGYDFAGLKYKIDYNLDTKSINYFSDVIEDNHSGAYWKDYYKYLYEKDNYTFYWDEMLYEKKKAEIKNLFYMPHFVNTEIYHNFNNNPEFDIMFAGRLDSDFRLNSVIDLMKHFKDKKFAWFAIEKHFLDALSRLADEEEKNILKKNYQGFIDSEEKMAKAINNTKIVFNFNAQGLSSLNYRTIQTLTCERLLISDDRLEARKLFKENESIVIFKSMDELKDKIQFYLNNENEYKIITKNARELIVNNHSSKVCVKKMLDLIGSH